MSHPSPWLASFQFRDGEEWNGNAGGRPKSKPLTDAMRLLLAGEAEKFKALPEPLRLQVEAWYNDALGGCAKSRALLLERVEGRVPQPIEHRELPALKFKNYFTSPKPAEIPGTVPTNGKHVEEVEAVPIEDDLQGFQSEDT